LDASNSLGKKAYVTLELTKFIHQFQFREPVRILACAFFLGLSIPAAHFGFLRISVMWRINTPTWNYIANYTLVCLSCFLGAGLLLCATKVITKSERVWVLLSVLGSFVVALVYTFRRLPLSQLTLSELLLVHFRDALGTMFWLTLFTLPVAAFIYYSLSFLEGRIQQALGADSP